MYDALDKNEVCILVTLDIRKAFDRVDREIVLSKSIASGIDPAFFRSYLSNRSHFATISNNNKLSVSCTLTTELGTVQGSCFSNLLSLLVMNDLPETLKLAM
jgi:hypothetical protein